LQSENRYAYNRGMKTKVAIKHFGTKAALAAALNIKPPSIASWGTTVPKQRQYELERITNGALKAEWPKQSNQRAA
jgi:hypothetical protein